MIHEMNKLAYFAKLLAFAISNPKKGKEVFNTKYQSMQDSTMNIHDYVSKQLDLDQIMITLFPNSGISVTEARKNTQILKNHISNLFAKLQSEKYPSKKKPYPTEYSIDDKSGLFLYLLCKIIQPEKVVETGVAYGLSSMYVLQALEENNKGFLYSIDSVFSPWQTKEMIGSVIPSNLKHRWKFNFGSSSEKLNDLMSSLNSVDIFLHDSLHTYKNMMFEFDTAWPFIAKNGFLISDDIGDNNAFYDFSTKMNQDSLILKQKENSFFGIIRKI